MSNLYKQHNIITTQSDTRVINSNQVLTAKLEHLMQHAKAKDGFLEGLDGVMVEVQPPEPQISLEEVRREAEEILQEAREQAKQIVQDAQSQADAITEDAKTQGQQQGYQEGQQKATLELEKEKMAQREKAHALQMEYQQLQEDLEPKILNAVCDIFEKVFSIQFNDNKEILLHLVKKAILKIESTKEFHIRVSEKNYQYLESNTENIRSQVGQNIKLEMEADASLNEMQCIIETDSGFFDCSIDVQLENLIKAIRSLSV